MTARKTPAHWKRLREQAQKGKESVRNSQRGPEDVRGYDRNDTGVTDPRKTRQWPRLLELLLPYGQPSPCIACGHPTWGRANHGPNGTGLGTLDHVIPFTERPDLGLIASNLRPIHFLPCPECSEIAGKPIRCSAIKGGYSLERCQRILRGKGIALPDSRREPQEPEGRL